MKKALKLWFEIIVEALVIAAMLGVLLFLVVYLPVASAAWKWRNPTANGMSFWREFGHAIRFEKLEKYQGNR